MTKVYGKGPQPLGRDSLPGHLVLKRIEVDKHRDVFQTARHTDLISLLCIPAFKIHMHGGFAVTSQYILQKYLCFKPWRRAFMRWMRWILHKCYTQVSGPVQTTCSNTLSSICTRHFHTLLCVHNPTKDSVIYVCLHAHALQITLHCSPASCLNVSLFAHVQYLQGICTIVQFIFVSLCIWLPFIYSIYIVKYDSRLVVYRFILFYFIVVCLYSCSTVVLWDTTFHSTVCPHM